MPVPRVLLLVPAQSYRHEAFAAAAAELGVELVMASDRCHTLAEHWGVPLAIDFSDPGAAITAVLDFARRASLDGVVATDDRSTIVAAEVAARLGLPANPAAAAERARNKRLERLALTHAGLRQPELRLVEADAGEEAIVAIGRELGFPCVVKPLLLSGSRGVIRADHAAGLVVAVARVRAILRATGGPQRGEPDADRVLVERFIPGVEVALEGFLQGGALEVLALFDKPDPLDGPFFEETLYVTPSRLPALAQDALAVEATAAARALGLERGPVHAELRWNPDGAWVIEVAGRSIGGLCSRTLRLGAGLSLERLILLDALGRELPPHRREQRAAGVMMLPIPRAGWLRAVHGVERALAVPGIESLEITAKLDHEIVPLPEGSSYLGFLFARGDAPGDVEDALRRAQRELEFVIAHKLAP